MGVNLRLVTSSSSTGFPKHLAENGAKCRDYIFALVTKAAETAGAGAQQRRPPPARGRRPPRAPRRSRFAREVCAECVSLRSHFLVKALNVTRVGKGETQRPEGSFPNLLRSFSATLIKLSKKFIHCHKSLK